MSVDRRSALRTLAALATLSSCRRGRPIASPLRIAAAADLALAFAAIAVAFEAESGERPTMTFGSTGLLAKQIAEGAPFDVFAAASVSFVDGLIAAGRACADTRALYARGRIVAWSKRGTRPARALVDLADARFEKIAIANPEHAPYGRAAKEALERVGIWSKVERRLVYGENVQQTMQFAQTGNAEVALVALSLTRGSDGDWLLVDDTLHAPIDQALAVVAQSKRPELARRFTAFVAAAPGRAIMRAHGFLLPGETVGAVGTVGSVAI